MSIEDLRSEIDRASRCNLNDGAFRIALTAAFSKSIRFVMEQKRCVELTISPFWLAPNLRSICEDLIVLSHIDSSLSDDKDEVITLLLNLDFQSAIHVQKDFFESFRPHQPIIKPAISKNRIKKTKSRLKEINRAFISDEESFSPSVRAMAKSQGLLVLYDYLYNATSRLVHFSPGTLMRMAWGEKDGIFECNPDALDRYYSNFIWFYSVQLLSAFVARFHAHLDISNELQQAIDTELSNSNSIVRWPELITFEELNAPNPWDDESTMRKQSFWNILIKDPGVVFTPKYS